MDEATFWAQIHAEHDRRVPRARSADPVERCPVCAGALTKQCTNHAGLGPDGRPQQYQYRRCVECLVLVRRDNTPDGWQPWFVFDEGSLTGFHKDAVKLL